MKILLTGANGYIGSRLLLSLLKSGHEVYGLVRKGGCFYWYFLFPIHYYIFRGMAKAIAK